MNILVNQFVNTNVIFHLYVPLCRGKYKMLRVNFLGLTIYYSLVSTETLYLDLGQYTQ